MTGIEQWKREVSLYLAGQTLSQLGSAIVSYAVIWYITLKTGSGAQFTLLLIASQLSMALTTVPGGVWADRYWRKALMIGADAGVALVTVGLAIFFLSGKESLIVIALALVARGLGSGIQAPASSAALPQIAPADKLLRINSINQALQALVTIAAPAIAAALLAYLPLGWILTVDVATAAIGITITVFIHIPRLAPEEITQKEEGIKGYFSHIADAVRYALAIPGLKRATILVLIMTTLVVPFAQMAPVYIVKLFGSEKWMLAAAEMLWSVGMVIGGVAIAAWGGLKNRMTMMMGASLVIGVAVMLMGFSPTIWVFLGVGFIIGLALPMLNTPAMTAMQELIPKQMMGRVIAFITLLNTVCGPVGMAIIGPLSDSFDIRWIALIGAGAAVVAMAALVVKGGPGSKLMAPEKPLAVG